MEELRIKTESLPERCEVCHKTDCFDPKINYCSRCVGINYCKEKEKDGFIRNQLFIRQKWRCCDNHLAHLLLVVTLFIGFSVILHTSFTVLTLLVFTFVFYMYFTGKTVVEANRERLLIKYSPLPIWPGKSLELRHIKGFYLSKSYDGFYIVKMIVGNRKNTETVFQYLSLEKAILIERHLTQWFNFSISHKSNIG
jgi:hypothetical protein